MREHLPYSRLAATQKAGGFGSEGRCCSRPLFLPFFRFAHCRVPDRPALSDTDAFGNPLRERNIGRNPERCLLASLFCPPATNRVRSRDTVDGYLPKGGSASGHEHRLPGC